MSQAITDDLLRLSQRLLDSITTADWATYEALCDPTLTAFEPEALGQLVESVGFHRYFFDLGGVRGKHQTTMASPRVRILGDTAIVTYVRLTQRLQADGSALTTSHEETRVWHRSEGQWRMVHFHRSIPHAG